MGMKLGFIGTGAMGSTMIKAVISDGAVSRTEILASDFDSAKLLALSAETGIEAVDNNTRVVDTADIIILAVKPNMVEHVLKECKSHFDDKKILVSFAVGVPVKFYRSILGEDAKIIRTMPNTPMLVGEGMTLLSYDKNISDEEIAMVRRLFNCAGKTEILDERLMNQVTALTGSSPAYVFIFIEAMADAAVLSGIPRSLAYKMAAQTVLGSARLVLETGKHPAELKDQVCSPGGTTIEAVASLEKNGFRYAVMDAMKECSIKAGQIGEKYSKV